MRYLVFLLTLLASSAHAQQVPYPAPMSLPNNNAQLKQIDGSINLRAARLGFTTPGDGGYIEYNWSTSNCPFADDGAQVQPTGVTGCWIADFPVTGVDVRVFGAKPDGVTDATAAISAADAAAQRAGLDLYFPGGAFLTSSCITQAALRWRGLGTNNTVIKTNSPSVCIVNMPAARELYSLSFQSSVTRTGGEFIRASANNIKLTDLTLNRPYNGFYLGAGANSVWMDDILVFEPRGAGILVDDCLNCQADHVNIINDKATALTTSVSLQLRHSGDFTCHNCSFIGSYYNIRINPGNGQTVVSVKMIGGFVDNGAYENMRIDPTGTGLVARSNFTGTWFTQAPVNNIIIAPAATAQVTGISFEDCEAYLSSGGSGLAISGATATDIIWNGGKIAQNNVGIFISNAHYITIANAIVGASSGFAGNTSGGISVGGTSSNIDIHDINGLGKNGSPFVVFTATGVNNRVHNNPGYNPTGVVSVTCTGPAPCVIPNGVFPATMYGYGGDVTRIATFGVDIMQGMGANPWSVGVGPGETITVIYNGTSIPTIKMVMH